jgi:hypothetical protein
MHLGSMIVAAALALPAGPAPLQHHQDSVRTQQVSFSDWLERLFTGSSKKGARAGLDAIGTLPEHYTDFGPNIWQDTPFKLVLRLLDDMPDRIASASEHRMARNLLVAITDPPPGDDGRGKMLALRVSRLMKLGNIEDVASLTRAIPGLPPDDSVARAEVEAELLAGEVETACIDLRAFAPNFREDWAEDGVVLCKARDGELDADAPPTDQKALGPLIKISGAPLSADSAHSDPAYLVGAARDPRLPQTDRLDAAFSAGRASAIDGDALAKIFHSARVATGLLPAGPPTDGVQAARLFLAIERTADPAQKLALAERGLFSPDGVLDTVGVAMLAPLRNVKPTLDLQSHAARFARLFYAIGDTDAATRWVNVASKAGVAELWPYRMLLKQANPEDLPKWAKQSRLDPPRLARILTILSAFDAAALPAGHQSVAGQDRPEPALGDLLMIDQAATSLHVGEATLRALRLLGSDGPPNAHPLALRRALAALDRVTLHDEARALAFEAITATLLGIDHRRSGSDRLATDQ